MRRHYKYLRRKLQKAKNPEAVVRINNKEQRIMKDIDHKLSHSIIETAVLHDVKVIKLERLANIRSTTRTSRKNSQVVEYVNPAYTSQTCPVCGHVHHANDRN